MSPGGGSGGRVAEAIEAVLGRAPSQTMRLSGGCVGDVYRVDLGDGERLVAKVDSAAGGQLDLEGKMLEALAPHLPVPRVIFAAPELLLMEFVEGSSSFTSGAETHAAELVAAMHEVTADAYGFDCDTLIGGLPQSNVWAGSWLAFFAEHRLMAMARQCQDKGRIDGSMVRRVDRLSGKLEEHLAEPVRPSLLHGDLWAGNVLAVDDRITGFIDPAVSYGHPEIELAFATLFSSFGRPFFDRYEELRPIPAGFHEERRHLYNLYPLLVHVCLFGGSYLGAVDKSLRRFGC